MLKEYQGALKDLDKADVLEPNNAFTLRNREVNPYQHPQLSHARKFYGEVSLN
jgi:hypothetical protein